MPIRPSEKARYPKNWPEIRTRILARARSRCEVCGVPNGAWICRDAIGRHRFVCVRNLRDAGYDRPPFKVATLSGVMKVITVVLTVAHLDHRPENCADDNLKALCQYHHLEYDRAQHRITAAKNRYARNGDLELPL